MGPGHGGPGEGQLLRTVTTCAAELQWGRATEGPERHLETGAGVRSRRFNGAGPRRARRASRAPRGILRPPASMGPGHGGPGEARRSAMATTTWSWLQWGRATEGPERSPSSTGRIRYFASMGPGHGGPGEYRALTPRRPSTSLLQWGRATEGPESMSVHSSSSHSPSLQWGRATEGPERPSEGTEEVPDLPRFNGAGPRRARRAIYCVSRGLIIRASMGPGHGGPGEKDAQLERPRPPMLQWGRATEGPESTGLRWRPGLFRRFNGAGPRRARRVNA